MPRAVTTSVLAITLSACRAEDECNEVGLPPSVELLRAKLQAASPTCLDAMVHGFGGSLGTSNNELPRASTGSLQALAACRVPLLLPRDTVAGWRAHERWASDDYLSVALPSSLLNAFVAPKDEVAARDALVASAGQLDGVAIGKQAEEPKAAARGEKRPALAEDPTGDRVDALATSQFFSDESALYFARWMGADDMAIVRADTCRRRGARSCTRVAARPHLVAYS